MRYFLLLILVLAACSSETSDAPTNTSLDVLVDGVPANVSGVQPTPVENGEARVAIFKGVVKPGNVYSAELLRTIDTPAYMDIDTGVDGDPFWITQASVEDANGNVLWTDRVNTMFQLLEFLELVVEQTGSSSLNLNRAQLYAFVGQQYPALLEFPVKVPVGIPGGKDFVLRVPNEDNVFVEVARVDIASAVENATPPLVEGKVTTLLQSGPASDRLDVVILGDGYRAEDEEAFDLDAQVIAERLQETEPYASQINMINIHKVFTPSVEKGAGYDCTGSATTDAGCKEDLRDTVFGTTFVITALADRLMLALGESDRVAMPLEIARIFDVAVQAQYDEVILISNAKRYSGFAGVYVALVTTFGGNRNLMADVAMHELGHSFGALGDEYQVDGDPCLFAEPRVPLPANIAAYTDDSFKWDRFFDGPVPIPTPTDRASEFPVGAYEGAYNCDFLYRPSRDCKMKSDESLPYCPVCTEQLVRRLYATTDPIVEPQVERLESGALKFSVVVASDNLTATWFLNDAEFGTGPSVTVEGKDVDGSENTLRVVVSDTSGRVRVEDPRTSQEQSWTIVVTQ
ncbi:MAG: M64 family metallopeptidase [bacterium]